MNPSDFTASTAATRPTQGTAATVSNMRPTPALGGARATQGQSASFATQMAAMSAPFSASAPALNSAYARVQNDVAAFVNDAVQGPAEGALPSQSSAIVAMRARAAGMGDASGAIMAAGANSASGDMQQQFLAQIRPWAAEAAAKLGVAPELVAAHAALESGWGQHPLGASNNLFGIKANQQWQGAVTSAATTEYVQGVAVKKNENFRSYPDQAAAFRDYAATMLDNPRYQQALNTGSDARAFAMGVARGGYATDPSYAGKLARLAQQIQQAHPKD